MSEPSRVSSEETRQKVVSGSALLVCAYDNEEKFKKVQLEGAISLNEFRDRLPTLHKNHEIIFYCS
ncbi:ArsR family transcriptional regulator [bacterium]|nr:MAG: ArsR family transcriptional regulator [bacterium]